jgi:hypothetical protein
VDVQGNQIGVKGTCQGPSGDGVQGFGSGNFSGVAGFGGNVQLAVGATAGTGVFGEGGTVIGSLGEGDGNGVRGHSARNDGTRGDSDANNKSGVFGFNSSKIGLAFGVSGETVSADGFGVFGFSQVGNGVAGNSGAGYGGIFVGGRAPLRLVPATTGTGAPTTGSHQRGEFFVDSNGGLFYCQADGTPGTWARVQLV